MSINIAANKLADLIEAGKVVYLPGGIAPPTAFINDLVADPERSRGLRMLTSIGPGLDIPLPVDRLDASAEVTGLFMQPALTPAQRDGRYRPLPVSYAGFVQYLRDEAGIDLAVFQVAPPDERGRYSLGPSVEFAPLVLAKARRVVALVNRNLPRMRDSLLVPGERFDYVCEIDASLLEYRTDDDAPTRAIAAHIASLIDDGATLQMGIGKVPTALTVALGSHRKLRLFSGMLSDGLMQLSEAGALDTSFHHTCCGIAGSAPFYHWAAEFECLRIRGCDVTHDPRILSEQERFFAVNSALEVDLFGQCNLEIADDRAVSGVGGAPDYARAARLSIGGCSIVGLNATYVSRRRGEVSRIVPRLGEPGIVSLPRFDVQCVATEFGIADLRGKCVSERAQAIIAIAAPQFREELQRAWTLIAGKL